MWANKTDTDLEAKVKATEMLKADHQRNLLKLKVTSPRKGLIRGRS